MLKRIIIAMIIVMLGIVYSFAGKITEGFEDKAVLKKWEVEGDVAIVTDQKHGGKSSLYVPAGSSAVWRVSKENKFGTVTIWVYDSCVNNKESTPGKNWNGPYFGLVNEDDDKFVFTPVWRPYMKPTGYGMIWTAESQWYSPWWSRVMRSQAGWNKFTFDCSDDKTLRVIVNDEQESSGLAEKVGENLKYFNKGFVGVCFGGRDDLGDKNEKFYFDDIEINQK